MDEPFIIHAFKAMGEETVLNVKIMTNKYTGHNTGYGFVNFTSDEAALSAMHKLNGKNIPGTNPPVKFRLNHNNTRTGAAGGKEYSIWVGDLTPEVDNSLLYDAFKLRYNSIKTAEVIYDPNGASKGYGFIRFFNEEEQKDALVHMNNYVGLGLKPLKVRTAVPKNPVTNSNEFPGQQQGGTGQNMNNQQQYYDPNQYWNNQYWGQYSGGMSGDYSQYYGMYGTGGMTNGGQTTPQGGDKDPSSTPKSTDKPKYDATPVEWNVRLESGLLNRQYLEQAEELWRNVGHQQRLNYAHVDYLF